MTEEPSPVIALEGLERRFGDRPALRGISVTVGEGQTLAVFCSYGAGKTTLLSVLATLLRPDAGTVRVLGASLPDEAWKARGRIGFLGHEPLLYPDLSARDNLLFHARLHGVEASRVDELLGTVGMARRARDPVRELSRGMVQRIAAARAVLHDPPLLLLDEPRAGLDPAAAEKLDPLIGRASGRTRVLVTHDTERGLHEADAVLGLRAGSAVVAGPAAGADAAAIRELYS